MISIKKITTLIILVLFSLILFSQENNKKITLENIFKEHTFSSKYVYGLRSMNNGMYYTTNEKGTQIVKYSYKTGKIAEVIFDNEKNDNELFKSFYNYEFSNDEQKILLTADLEYIYRHSYTASYYIYNIKSKTIEPLSENGKQQLATFSPDGLKIAFVRDNNLFIKYLTGGEEIQITSDGEHNKIINGAPDWVYEEEFSFSKGFRWSVDGSKLAFYKFDESNVKQYNLTYYGGLYPELYLYKYPKAGEDNSVVSIHIYNLKDKKIKNIDIGEEADQYIPRIKWTKNTDILSIYRMNRLQNKLEILLADANSGKSNVVYTEENKYYIEINDDLTFLEDKKHFVISSIQDGYNHIYLYDIEGNLIKQVTKGSWNVTSFLGYDNEIIYYISTENSPLQHDVYAIGINGLNKRKLSEKSGTNNAVFSKTYSYYINYFSDVNTPYYITLHNTKGKLIRVLEDNIELKNTINEYGFSKKEFFSFKTSENVELNGWIIKPLNFDENKKYPLFMYVYGGPGSQSVRDMWGRRDAWYQLLAQKGYIIVCVDGRGTKGKSEDFEKSTYKQLGKYETIDQIEAAKYLGSKPYIDETRIGIFGWSYGGYMSSLCLMKGADVFKMAIAVAPVTNWRYYDNIYTERYMRTPQENADGYDDNSPINHVEKLIGKFLLVHGTADDNVHYQNSIELTTKLIEANKQFEMMFYPNKNHFINGGNTDIHLYTKMTEFILNNL
ncbi:MAG: S9 family peptidase [Bacteroidales bacterium]|nr:S9 family peptidase [Bacteroidales bacterium]